MLPAHEHRFVGPPGPGRRRSKAHHQARIEEAIAAIRAGVDTAWGIAERMTWNRPWDDMQVFVRRAAVGEALAHLEYLQRLGVVREEVGEPSHWQVVDRGPSLTGSGPVRIRALARPGSAQRVTASAAASRTTAHDRARRVALERGQQGPLVDVDHLPVAKRHEARRPRLAWRRISRAGVLSRPLRRREGKGEEGGEDGTAREASGLGHVGGQHRERPPVPRQSPTSVWMIPPNHSRL